MQNDQRYSKVLDLIQTREDFNLLNQELDLVEETQFEVKPRDISGMIRKSTSYVLTEFLQTEDKKKVIDELRKELLKVKFMEITTSYQPSIKNINDISLLINQDQPQKVAIDIKLDPMILGGAQIAYEGRFFDGSLSSKLENILKKYV